MKRLNFLIAQLLFWKYWLVQIGQQLWHNPLPVFIAVPPPPECRWVVNLQFLWHTDLERIYRYWVRENGEMERIAPHGSPCLSQQETEEAGKSLTERQIMPTNSGLFSVLSCHCFLSIAHTHLFSPPLGNVFGLLSFSIKTSK